MTIDMTFERRLELTRRDEREDTRRELVQNALKNGGSPEEISRLLEVPLEEVIKAQEKMPKTV